MENLITLDTFGIKYDPHGIFSVLTCPGPLKQTVFNRHRAFNLGGNMGIFKVQIEPARFPEIWIWFEEMVFIFNRTIKVDDHPCVIRC